MAIIIKRAGSHVTTLGSVVASQALQSIAAGPTTPLEALVQAVASDTGPEQQQVPKAPSAFATLMEICKKAGSLPADQPPPPPPKEAPAEVLPWDTGEPDDYTIIHALADFAQNKRPKKVLRLVHKHTAGCTYTVKAYDIQTGRAVLEGGFKGAQLKPVITEREIPLYFPVWGPA